MPNYRQLRFWSKNHPIGGKFSPDRDYWEQLHHARYTKWQLGYSAADIAGEEGVTANNIRHSINWCESRLSNAQVVQARNTRLRLRTFAQLSEKYIEELEKLMTDANPIIRSRALEAFKKTVGLEGSGVHVNVNSVNQTAIVEAGHLRNFEQALDRVHRMHTIARVESHPTTEPVSATPVIDVNPGGDDPL